VNEVVADDDVVDRDDDDDNALTCQINKIYIHNKTTR